MFKVVACDTDSIFFKKPNEEAFSKEEIERLNESINSLFEKGIRWELNGYYSSMIAVKAKNYILWDGKTVKYKGSAIKASTKEVALKEFIQRLIDAMLNDRKNYSEIYHEYVKEILAIVDIKRWVSRKTITDKTLNSERTNESKIRQAIEGTGIREGDRAYFYFKSDNTLSLAENFDGDYNVDKFLEKLYKTSQIFNTVLDEGIFPNYKLKRNKKLLEALK